MGTLQRRGWQVPGPDPGCARHDRRIRELEWDGRDRDGDQIANGVYLYKLILDDGSEKKEVIEKLVILN